MSNRPLFEKGDRGKGWKTMCPACDNPLSVKLTKEGYNTLFAICCSSCGTNWSTAEDVPPAWLSEATHLLLTTHQECGSDLSVISRLSVTIDATGHEEEELDDAYVVLCDKCPQLDETVSSDMSNLILRYFFFIRDRVEAGLPLIAESITSEDLF